MWLPWTWSLPLAGLLLALGWWARWSATTRRGVGATPTTVSGWATAAAVAFEASRVALLYTLWQLAGELSVTGIERADERGRRIWDLERALHLPSELTIQKAALAALPHGWLVQAANIWYGGAHVPGMGIFLAWLFLRHRDRYPGWRNCLVGITFVSLLVQLVPVAPPRLLGGLGLVDTGVAYGQSVYAIGGSSVAGQLQAMPSLHVGWAALIAWACAQVGGRARWIGAAHLVITLAVVVCTANHYWLDGIVDVALLAPFVLVLTRRRPTSVAHHGRADAGDHGPSGHHPPATAGEAQPDRAQRPGAPDGAVR